MLWVGKLIVDEVVGAIGHPSAEVPWARLGTLLAIEFAIAVGGEGLSRLSALFESLLGDLFANRTSVDLMRHAASLDLEQFEDPELYDKLERARRQTVNRIGLFTLLLSTLQDLITLVTLSAALVAYVPWLLVLLVVAVLPSLLGETHFASLGYSLLFSWTPERRLLDYLRYIGASDISAKEVKLFGLSDFLVGRYERLSQEFYEANKALALRRGLVSSLLAAVGTLGYYGAYVVIIYLTVIQHRGPAGVFTIGVLTFLTGSFRQSRDLIQRVLLVAHPGVRAEPLSRRPLQLPGAGAAHPRLRGRAPGAGARSGSGFVFEDVGFRYPGSERWAVRHLDFTLEPGERHRARRRERRGQDDAGQAAGPAVRPERRTDSAGRRGSPGVRRREPAPERRRDLPGLRALRFRAPGEHRGGQHRAARGGAADSRRGGAEPGRLGGPSPDGQLRADARPAVRGRRGAVRR